MVKDLAMVNGGKRHTEGGAVTVQVQGISLVQVQDQHHDNDFNAKYTGIWYITLVKSYALPRVEWLLNILAILIQVDVDTNTNSC